MTHAADERLQAEGIRFRRVPLELHRPAAAAIVCRPVVHPGKALVGTESPRALLLAAYEKETFA